MTSISEANAWLDILNSFPEEKEAYLKTSLNPLIEFIIEQFYALNEGIDPDDLFALSEELPALCMIFEDYLKTLEDVPEIRVQGKGMYLPGKIEIDDTDDDEDATVEGSESTEVLFLDDTQGISGIYGGITIDRLPTYTDALRSGKLKPDAKPMPCFILRKYREYSDSGIALEPTGRCAYIPIIGQDLSFTHPEER